MNPITLFLGIACALASLQPLRLFPGLRLLPLSGSLRRLTDWGGGGAQHVVLIPQIPPPGHACPQPAPYPDWGGPLRKAAELFCAGTSNCRIRCVVPRHGSPAAFFDERAPIPRGNLVERDELGCCIGLLPEFLDADRSQRCYDRGFSALVCHFLSGAAECPSERRKPYDRERNSADHCTPYRWFHPGMDLHFVTLTLGEGNFSLLQPQSHIGVASSRR